MAMARTTRRLKKDVLVVPELEEPRRFWEEVVEENIVAVEPRARGGE